MVVFNSSSKTTWDSHGHPSLPDASQTRPRSLPEASQACQANQPDRLTKPAKPSQQSQPASTRVSQPAQKQAKPTKPAKKSRRQPSQPARPTSPDGIRNRSLVFRTGVISAFVQRLQWAPTYSILIVSICTISSTICLSVMSSLMNLLRV